MIGIGETVLVAYTFFGIPTYCSSMGSNAIHSKASRRIAGSVSCETTTYPNALAVFFAAISLHFPWIFRLRRQTIKHIAGAINGDRIGPSIDANVVYHEEEAIAVVMMEGDVASLTLIGTQVEADLSPSHSRCCQRSQNNRVNGRTKQYHFVCILVFAHRPVFQRTSKVKLR